MSEFRVQAEEIQIATPAPFSMAGDDSIWGAAVAVLAAGAPHLVPTCFPENLDLLTSACPNLTPAERLAALRRLAQTPEIMRLHAVQPEAQTIYRVLGGAAAAIATDHQGQVPKGRVPASPDVDGTVAAAPHHLGVLPITTSAGLIDSVAGWIRFSPDAVKAVLNSVPSFPHLGGALLSDSDTPLFLLSRTLAGVVFGLALQDSPAP